MRRPWPAFWREPSLHFVALGGLLFLIHPLLAPSPPSAPEVVITADRVRSLADGWYEQWQRQPTSAELDRLVADEVRTAILAREAEALGLHHGDPAIQVLLREKMDLIAEHGAAASEPSDAELAAFYATRGDMLGGGPTISFEQILFDPARRGDAAERDAGTLLAKLAHDDDAVDPAALGDQSTLAGEYAGLPEWEVESIFGSAFKAALAQLPEGTWRGPLRSAYGIHLVKVTGRQVLAPPPLAEVRDVVIEQWRQDRGKALSDDAYERVRQRYRVTVQQP